MLKRGSIDIATCLYQAYSLSALLITAAESKDSDQTVGAMKRWLSAKITANGYYVLIMSIIQNTCYQRSAGIQHQIVFPRSRSRLYLSPTTPSPLRIGRIIHVKKACFFNKLQHNGESIAILAHMSEPQISGQHECPDQACKLHDNSAKYFSCCGAMIANILDELPLALAGLIWAKF